VRAVDGISFEISKGVTLGLVGESGCGKTTTARLILSLETLTEGSIRFKGTELSALTRAQRRQYRRSVQAVFQDPWSSLNPRMRASEIIAEPLRVNERLSGSEMKKRVVELLESVGLEAATARSYPHEFSGGQRQRIAIARALSLKPAMIVLDEPVSSLDVSIRAQLMNLLKDMRAEHDMTYLLIAHDLSTVEYLTDRAAVMYLGVIVEEGASDQLFQEPLHPYTQALVSAAVPTQPGDRAKPIVLTADVPSASHIPPGCRFHTRCPFAFDRCTHEVPVLREVREGRKVACHLY